MKLNKEQCVLLDTVLASFDSNGTLSREGLLQIFNDDEPFAYSLICVLVSMGLVTEGGRTEEYDLPLMIFRESRAILFQRNEGFLKKFEEQELQVKKDASKDDLQTKNLELQNENLAYQKTIRERDERIKYLEEKNKSFELLKNVLWVLGGLITVGGFCYKIWLVFR